MSTKYGKKSTSKEFQGRRVQTEAVDNDDVNDLQSAILRFKNLQENKTTRNNKKSVGKKPEQKSSLYLGKKENNQSQHYGQPKKQSKSPHQLPLNRLYTFVNDYQQTVSTNTNSLLIPAPSQDEDYTNATFTNLKAVGSGTFGVVYKSKVNETNEIVAIKKVLQDKRYKNRELQVLQELNHPNVLKMKHAYFTEENMETYLHVVMDYYSETLYSYNRQFVKQGQGMPEILTKLYAYQLLRSIGYIAQKAICHRDIKPHNVLINPQTNRLILCDFGSAKRLVKTEPNISYICSRCYRAPELIFGATDYTTQIDVWSVGCVIAEMFNGEPLFLGESAVDQLVEIIKVLGTPSKEEVYNMNNHYDMNQYKFVQIKKRDWKKVIKVKNDPKALDLISSLLTYSPNIRYTAYQALCHPYFDCLRDENYLKQLQAKKINIPDLFDFTKQELSNNIDLYNKLVPKWYLL